MLTYLLFWVAALRDRLADAVFRRRVVELDDMPGHPERLRPIGDLDADTAFWNTAEQLLGDPEDPDLADVCEELRWMR
ncbi:hypothetical protein E1264_17890 [Actinomadura sp. KC216]|uniref:hypothetical protein n=1 Tax=Actinomadura sp. KC216 TaxID=2530370 RepID=UPI001047AE65|nr:hypothetical protein [Actinomadura sp. KC216]TDB86470.1 hypothetical protein E1264_17890 [Actinomadura sp. KC216]